MSFVRNSEAPDTCLPAWAFAGIGWTCATLRRRYRVVSGNVAAISSTTVSPQAFAQASSVLDERTKGPTSNNPPTPMRERSASDADYFGDTSRELIKRPASSPPGPSEMSIDTPLRPFPTADAMDKVDYTRPSFDWTRISVTPHLPPHIQFARAIDWEATSLGPIESWSSDLRAMSNLIMGSPHAAAMYWGPDYVAIYNEAYTLLAGQKHPSMMGSSYKDAWSEIWDAIRPVFDSAWHSGQATMKHDDRLFVMRHGFLEETYFSWSIVPLVGGDGSVVALYNPAFENTVRKVNERRMFTLRELGERTSLAQNAKGFWGLVKKGLEFNEEDVPFALIYSVSDELSESEVSSMQSGSVAHPPTIVLEGTLGVPPNHPSAPATIDLRSSEVGFAPFMRESMQRPGTPVVLTKEAGTLQDHLTDGFQWRGFGDPCRTAVVFPVHPTVAGDAIVGFIVLGINPRRPYSEDYQLFIDLLSRQLANSMASVVLFEDEIKRGQRAARLAAMDRQELSLQLRLRTQEAVESEYKFTRMAEFAPVGMFIADGDGRINYSNETWWEISRHPRTEATLNSWMDSVHNDDRQGVIEVWQQLVRNKEQITHEFRFKAFRINDGNNSMETWALMSAYPEKDESGEVKTIFGCITDISQQKWAESFQKQRREEAVELKRQQENFIDITSHEMRNPLSAILQCADEILTSIAQLRPREPALSADLRLLLDNCTEAAGTISLCASHQKRIVDDILTLSKLDSQLLLVTPVDVQVVAVVRDVLRMFEPELNSHNIRGEFQIEKNFQDLAIDWVKLDPSRLRQVLINLMTNAVKFTQSREKRSILITMDASPDGAEPPSGVTYFQSRTTDRQNLTDDSEWGQGPKINLHFTVKDTGPGLSEQEKTMLFQRFSQTSPRTHVQYGGSGLGLFISRILSELQGGQIGVVSEPGIGSTFAFFVKCRQVHQAQLSPSTTMTDSNLFQASKEQGIHKTQVAYITKGNKPPTPSASPGSVSLSQQTAARDPAAPPPVDVLIVEDNLVNQKVLQRQLHKCGNNTFVANHGGEALEALRRSQFWRADARGLGIHDANGHTLHAGQGLDGAGDLSSQLVHISVVLMDLEMPVMDGMTCARRIRALEREGIITNHVPIIAVTAYARPEQIADAKAAGIDDVISKPFRIPDLIPKIAELVTKHDTLRRAET